MKQGPTDLTEMPADSGKLSPRSSTTRCGSTGELQVDAHVARRELELLADILAAGQERQL